MMYCTLCGLHVATETIKTGDRDEARQHAEHLDEVEGNRVKDVGSTINKQMPGGAIETWEIWLRVDKCANCGTPLRGRTFMKKAL